MNKTKAELEFDLTVCKKQIQGCNELSSLLNHENDQLYEILELLVDHFSPFFIGDQWTAEDLAIMNQAKERLEELK